MTRIPIKTRVPIGMWTLAVLVTLFSLITSTAQPYRAEMPAAQHAKVIVGAGKVMAGADKVSAGTDDLITSALQ